MSRVWACCDAGCVFIDVYCVFIDVYCVFIDVYCVFIDVYCTHNVIMDDYGMHGVF